MSLIRRVALDKNNIREVPSEKVYTRGPSLTVRSHAKACDINTIVARYQRTGELPRATHQPQFADTTAFQHADTLDLINRKKALEASIQADLERARVPVPETPQQPQINLKHEPPATS